MSTIGADFGLGLSDSARDDLAHLAKNSGSLGAIAACASELQPGVNFPEAVRIVSEKTGVAVQVIERVLWAILNLYRLKTRFRMETVQLIKAISANIETQSSEENLKAWRRATETIVNFLDALNAEHPLVINKKAEQLSFAHQNLFTDARLITDIRPVFDSSGNKMLESLVIQTLLVDYFDGNESKRIEFALDARDVAQLRRLCERAEHKASTLKESLSGVGLAIAIVGGEDS